MRHRRDPGRDAEERSDDIIAALAISAGAVVADVGSGTGYFTWRLSRKVGSLGSVIAVDVNRQAPASTRHKMSLDEIRSEIEPLGFELERILDFLPAQHGLVFTKR